MSTESIIEIIAAFFEGIAMILQVLFFVYLKIDTAEIKNKNNVCSSCKKNIKLKK